MDNIQQLPPVSFTPSLHSFNPPPMYPILDAMISPFLSAYLPFLFAILGGVFLVKSFK